MNHDMKNIDPKLAALGFNNIARLFICKKCHLVPLNFYKCTDNRCEEVVCLDCKIGDKCSTCQTKLPTIARGDLKELFDLINFKCPNYSKGCTSIVRLKNIKPHFEECNRNFNELAFQWPNCPRPGKIEDKMFPNQKIIPNISHMYLDPNYDPNSLLNKKKEKILDPEKKNPKKQKTSWGLDDFVADSDSSSEVFEFSSLKEKLNNDNFIIKTSVSNLEELEKEFLKDALLHRGLAAYGNKAEMASKLLCYVRAKFYTDSKLDQLIKKRELELLLNDELEEILELRGLKKGGNKDEKMKTLKMYLNIKKNL